MNTWKVTVNINNNTEQKVIYIRDAETEEEAYSRAKRYFINERPEIDFCGVEKAEIIGKLSFKIK
jgi:hypothetical protein